MDELVCQEKYQHDLEPFEAVKYYRYKYVSCMYDITLVRIACTIIMYKVYVIISKNIYLNSSLLSRYFSEASGRLLKIHKEFTFQDTSKSPSRPQGLLFFIMNEIIWFFKCRYSTKY